MTAALAGLVFGYVAGRYGPRMVGLYRQSRLDGFSVRDSASMAWRHGRS